MRLVKAVIAQRGVLVQDLVRGCLGSSDEAPVESPQNFMIWEEVCCPSASTLPTSFLFKLCFFMQCEVSPGLKSNPHHHKPLRD
jgi:hypothetical protein